MGITEQQIMENAQQSGHAVGEGYSVWAVRMPSALNLALFGSMATAFDMKYHIMSVVETGVLIVAVDAMGRLTDKQIWLGNESIQKVTVKKGLLSYKVTLETTYGTLKYQLNKTMVGSAFQKTNIENVMQMLEKK